MAEDTHIFQIRPEGPQIQYVGPGKIEVAGKRYDVEVMMNHKWTKISDLTTVEDSQRQQFTQDIVNLLKSQGEAVKWGAFDHLGLAILGEKRVTVYTRGSEATSGATKRAFDFDEVASETFIKAVKSLSWLADMISKEIPSSSGEGTIPPMKRRVTEITGDSAITDVADRAKTEREEALKRANLPKLISAIFPKASRKAKSKAINELLSKSDEVKLFSEFYNFLETASKDDAEKEQLAKACKNPFELFKQFKQRRAVNFVNDLMKPFSTREQTLAALSQLLKDEKDDEKIEVITAFIEKVAKIKGALIEGYSKKTMTFDQANELTNQIYAVPDEIAGDEIIRDFKNELLTALCNTQIITDTLAVGAVAPESYRSPEELAKILGDLLGAGHDRFTGGFVDAQERLSSSSEEERALINAGFIIQGGGHGLEPVPLFWKKTDWTSTFKEGEGALEGGRVFQKGSLNIYLAIPGKQVHKTRAELDLSSLPAINSQECSLRAFGYIKSVCDTGSSSEADGKDEELQQLDFLDAAAQQTLKEIAIKFREDSGNALMKNFLALGSDEIPFDGVEDITKRVYPEPPTQVVDIINQGANLGKKFSGLIDSLRAHPPRTPRRLADRLTDFAFERPSDKDVQSQVDNWVDALERQVDHKEWKIIKGQRKAALYLSSKVSEEDLRGGFRKSVDSLLEAYGLKPEDFEKEAKVFGIDTEAAKVKMVNRLAVYEKGKVESGQRILSIAKRVEMTGFEPSVVRGVEKAFKRLVIDPSQDKAVELEGKTIIYISPETAKIYVEKKEAGRGAYKVVKLANEYFSQLKPQEPPKFVVVKPLSESDASGMTSTKRALGGTGVATAIHVTIDDLDNPTFVEPPEVETKTENEEDIPFFAQFLHADTVKKAELKEASAVSLEDEELTRLLTVTSSNAAEKAQIEEAIRNRIRDLSLPQLKALLKKNPQESKYIETIIEQRIRVSVK